MKKSQLRLLIKGIVNESLILENLQDPTKEEMFNYLRSLYGNEEGFRDDAEVAMYWFANFYHGGQSSNLYSVLSNSRFNPGPVAKGPEPHSSEEMMYEDLVLKFAPSSKNATEIQKKHNSLNEDVDLNSPDANDLYLKMLDIANLDDPSYRLITALKYAILKRVTNPKELQQLISVFNNEFGGSHVKGGTPWEYYKKEDLEEKIKSRLNEVISQKTTDIINKWRTELNDDRKVAVKIIDNVLEKKIGLSSADLPDTTTFMSGLDDIEVLLKDGNYEQAIRQAVDTAKEMVAEEGGEGLMENERTNAIFDKNKKCKHPNGFKFSGRVPNTGDKKCGLCGASDPKHNPKQIPRLGMFENREIKPVYIFKNKQGKSFKACNKQCANGFLADRAAGLIYGPYKDDSGHFLKDAEEASMKWNRCAYCTFRSSKGGVKEGDEADAVNDMWAGSDDDLKARGFKDTKIPTQKHIQKALNKNRKLGRDYSWDDPTVMDMRGMIPKKKTVQDFDWNAIKKNINKGTLKENEQVIYKDRQGGRDVYWMDNHDSGGKIDIRPEAVPRMIKRGHRVVNLDPDPRMAKRQPDPDLTNYSDLQETEIKKCKYCGKKVGEDMYPSNFCSDDHYRLWVHSPESTKLKENTDDWDVNKYKILKRKYNEAVKNGKTEFVIFGHTMLVEYAKYFLEHLSYKFGGIRENSTKTCQKCKGNGHYTTTLKDFSGKNNHGMGNTHIVPCDFPGCHNGIIDSEENRRAQGIIPHGKRCGCNLKEVSDEDADMVEYHSQRKGENPFKLRTPNGMEKFEYVNAKYPSGKIDIGVYAFSGDIVYGYNTFKKKYNIAESINEGKFGVAAMSVLMAGYIGLQTPAKQYISNLSRTSEGQKIMLRVKQIWNGLPQVQKTADNAKQLWLKTTRPIQINMPDPNQPLPSEKNMNSWDLAQKYSDRNANVAQRLQPIVKKYLPSVTTDGNTTN